MLPTQMLGGAGLELKEAIEETEEQKKKEAHVGSGKNAGWVWGSPFSAIVWLSSFIFCLTVQ